MPTMPECPRCAASWPTNRGAVRPRMILHDCGDAECPRCGYKTTIEQHVEQANAMAHPSGIDIPPQLPIGMTELPNIPQNTATFNTGEEA